MGLYEIDIVEGLIKVSADIIKSEDFRRGDHHKIARTLERARRSIINAFLYIGSEENEFTQMLHKDDYSRQNITLQISRFYIETGLIWELGFSYGEVLEFEKLLKQHIFIVEVPE